MVALFGPMPERSPLVEMGVRKQPLLLQELHGPVHGGDVDLRVRRMDATEDVVDADVPGNRFDDVEDERALYREAVAALLEGGAELTHDLHPPMQWCAKHSTR